MADTKISQLPSATTPLAGAELVPLVQSGATVQTPTNELSKLTAATANTFTVKQVIEVTDNTNAALRITQLGTADALRVEDSTNPDSTPFIIDASGNVGIGTTSPSSYLTRCASVAPSDYGPSFVAVSNSSAANWARIDLKNVNVATNTYWYKDQIGTMGLVNEGAHAMVFGTSNTERVRIDSSGNVLVTGPGGLGYGTGAGGTVTQTTNKNTNVTLNKTTGQITMASNNLAANATAVFNVFNDKVTSKDVVVVTHSADGGTAGAYTVAANTTGAGFFNVRVTNVSGGALAEAVVLNFVVIKGSNA